MTAEQEYLISLIKAAELTAPLMPPGKLDVQKLLKLASASRFDNILYE